MATTTEAQGIAGATAAGYKAMYRAKALGMVLTGVRIQKALGCRYSDGFAKPDCFVPPNDIFWDAWGGRSQILEDTAANCSRGYLGTGLSTESWKLEIAESVETVAQLAKLRAAVNRVKVIVLLSPYRGMMLLL